MTTTPATLYTRPDGTEYDEKQSALIDNYAEGLVSGRAFRLAAASLNSVNAGRYRPPTRREGWAHAMTTIGQMAAQSDQHAQIANAILGHVNLYLSDPESAAQVYANAEKAIAAGYDDVILRSSPEPGRPSSWHKPYSLNTLLSVSVWLTEATAKFHTGSLPTIGWCLDALLRANRVRVYLPQNSVVKWAA